MAFIPFNDLTFWKFVPWENFIVVELSNKLSLEQEIMNDGSHYGKNCTFILIWHGTQKWFVFVSSTKKVTLESPWQSWRWNSNTTMIPRMFFQDQGNSQGYFLCWYSTSLSKNWKKLTVIYFKYFSLLAITNTQHESQRWQVVCLKGV